MAAAAAANEEVLAVITLGYKSFCMPLESAMLVAKAMATAEVYEAKYHSREEGGTTYHVYPNEKAVVTEIGLITRDLYRMARMAGKPET